MHSAAIRAVMIQYRHSLPINQCCPPAAVAAVRLSMGGKLEEPVLLMKVQGAVTGLALDWIHKLLYWTSTESGSVHIGLLDGSAQRPLITGLDRPSALAVDPLHRCDEPDIYGSSTNIFLSSKSKCIFYTQLVSIWAYLIDVIFLNSSNFLFVFDV